MEHRNPPPANEDLTVDQQGTQLTISHHGRVLFTLHRPPEDRYELTLNGNCLCIRTGDDADPRILCTADTPALAQHLITGLASLLLQMAREETPPVSPGLRPASPRYPRPGRIAALLLLITTLLCLFCL